METIAFVIGAVGLLLAIWAEFRARRSDRANERAVARRERAESDLSVSQQRLHDLTARVPEITAAKLQSAFDLVSDAPDPGEDLRGWEGHAGARVGYAKLTEQAEFNDLLIEFPFGAHSAALLVLAHDSFDELTLLGAVFNGTGHRFHVRERSDGAGSEVITLDYINPLDDDRAFADMPVQPVYYRWLDGAFVEVGRGEAWDPRELWSVPESVLPLLNRRGLEESREREEADAARCPEGEIR